MQCRLQDERNRLVGVGGGTNEFGRSLQMVDAAAAPRRRVVCALHGPPVGVGVVEDRALLMAMAMAVVVYSVVWGDLFGPAPSLLIPLASTSSSTESVVLYLPTSSCVFGGNERYFWSKRQRIQSHISPSLLGSVYLCATVREWKGPRKRSE